MSCSGPNATPRPRPKEPDSPPREQQVRFWNNKQEVKPPPLSPISCNRSHCPPAPTTVRRSRTHAEKRAEELQSAELPLKKLSVATAKKPRGVDLAAPETPHSASSHQSGSFVSVTLGKMAALRQSLQEGAERPPSPARDDALDAAVAASTENPGKVQKHVTEIERKESKEGGFLGKVFSRKPSPARLTIPAEPAAKVLSRKTSPPSPAGLRSNGLPPKRALSPQPFRAKTVEILTENRSQSAFQPRGAGLATREPSNERGRKFSTSPQRDSTSRHTKDWVNALKPPGLPAAHESRKDSEAKALRDRRSHAVAMMQSAHSHREGAALLQSPSVSNSEDEDMWDAPGEADRLSSDSAEGSENEHLKLDRSELMRRSASDASRAASRADIQSVEFARLVQRQKSFEESAQRPRPVERRAGAVVDGRTEALFSRETHSFSVAQWKKEMGAGMAHTVGHSGSFGGGKAVAGLSADALRNRQGESPSNASFGFAFDNAQFSDRVLVLEISADVNHELDGHGADAKHPPNHAAPVRKPIHINSAIVAVKSQYFYNLLGENQQHAAVMRIRPEDEAPVLDMLRFMYSGELRASAPEELAQVLIVSDRYAVGSCFKYTFRQLSAVAVDALSACLFLDLPRHLKDPGQIQNLVLMARSWLVVHFRDLEKTYRMPEFLNLSLMGVRTILESNVLQISSEVVVFNALVNWSRHHFPDSESQRAKVVAKLAHLIRFPFMPTEALRQALDMPELNSDVGRGLIVEALFFKAEPFFKQNKLAESETAHSRYVPRSNDSRLGVTLAPMDESGRQASVFFELPKTQFQNLHPGGHVTSKAFALGGQTLSAVVAKKAGKNSATDGILSLVIHNGVAARSKIVGEYEFFTRFHTMDPFQSVARGKLGFKSGKEEQGQSTVKFPEDKNTMIYIRADLVIKS